MKYAEKTANINNVKSNTNKKQATLGGVRIIAGKYRGRKLSVGNRDGLRPTGNRIRETLFNWISPDIAGSTCVDLFSGSGALAFEAASRQAKHVFAVELDRASAKLLQQQAKEFQCDNLSVCHQRAEDWLKQYTGELDIVFVDPPFHEGLHQTTLDAITQHDGCHEYTLIYVEADIRTAIGVPTGWHWYRQQTAGDVFYGLLTQED